MRSDRPGVAGIRRGEVDALVVSGEAGDRVFTLKGANHAYRLLIEQTSEGAVTLAADETILFCNPLRFHRAGAAREDRGAPLRRVHRVGRPDNLFMRRPWRAENECNSKHGFAGQDGAAPVSLSFNRLDFDDVQITCVLVNGQRLFAR